VTYTVTKPSIQAAVLTYILIQRTAQNRRRRPSGNMIRGRPLATHIQNLLLLNFNGTKPVLSVYSKLGQHTDQPHLRKICIILPRFLMSGDLHLWPLELRTGAPVTSALGNQFCSFFSISVLCRGRGINKSPEWNMNRTLTTTERFIKQSTGIFFHTALAVVWSLKSKSVFLTRLEWLV